MKTALVTLGRLPKGLDICRALSRADWRVIVAEPSRRHLCGLSRYVAKSFAVTAPNENAEAYLRDMLSIVETENVSLIAPVSEEILHISQIVPRLPPNVRFMGENHEALLRLHDKLAFNNTAKSHGFFAPETYELGTPEAEALVASNDVVVKPALTCSGQGLSFVNRGGRLPEPQSGKSILVQRAIAGRHSSSFSVAHKGRVLGTVLYEPEIVSGTVSVAFRRIDLPDYMERMINNFVRETQHSGFISFDFIIDTTGKEWGPPEVIECNPRATSGIHFVEEASLAQAMLNPEKVDALSFKRHRVMYQLWPTLTETQASMFRWGRGYFHKMRTMLVAKEANFQWTDPLPVWGQPYAAWDILKRSAAQGQSFGEASTHDIAWFGQG